MDSQVAFSTYVLRYLPNFVIYWYGNLPCSNSLK
jgi:hypothetical protein